jgi:hypothetical protein
MGVRLRNVDHGRSLSHGGAIGGCGVVRNFSVGYPADRLRLPRTEAIVPPACLPPRRRAAPPPVLVRTVPPTPAASC